MFIGRNFSSYARDRVLLTRGPKKMVLFRTCPSASVAKALDLAGVAIGLALSADELPAVPSFDPFSYVFVGIRRRGQSPLGAALADLEGNGWTVGGAPVDPTDQPHDQPTASDRDAAAARHYLVTMSAFLRPTVASF